PILGLAGAVDREVGCVDAGDLDLQLFVTAPPGRGRAGLDPVVRRRGDRQVPPPPPVRFLPKWDNVLLAFADRTRVLPEQYRKRIIGMNGDVAQTFLVDGLVAGTWRFENGRVITEPFGSLSRPAQRELKDEAERLETFLAD